MVQWWWMVARIPCDWVIWDFVWNLQQLHHENFCWDLVWDLINNPLYWCGKEPMNEKDGRISKTKKSASMSWKTDLWDRWGWKNEAKFQYQQFICKGTQGKNSQSGVRGHKFQWFNIFAIWYTDVHQVSSNAHDKPKQWRLVKLIWFKVKIV